MALRLTWPKKRIKDTYTGVSFQNMETINKLMDHGSVTASYKPVPTDSNRIEVSPMRWNKTNFYAPHLEIDVDDDNNSELFFYAFNNIPTYFYDKHMPDFCSLEQVSCNWSNLMGYYKLADRGFIQLELPKDNCVVGLVDSVKVFNGDYTDDANIELVFKELNMKDVVEIYVPVETFRYTYGKIKFKSVLNNNPKAMFSGECYFAGNARYHNDVLSQELTKGLTLLDNAARMTDDSMEEVLKKLYISKHGETSYNCKKASQQFRLCMDILHQYKDYIVIEV